jgi:Ser/Thr protein kinase RdoA (MazF antagonist)
VSELASPDEILAVAQAAVGPCRVAADRSWPHGESIVLELLAASGDAFVAKAYRQRAKFEAELFAYQHWVPSLGSNAPCIVTSSVDACVVLMTKVNGRPADELSSVDERALFRRAGELLVRFHSSASPVRLSGYAAAQRARLAAWLTRDTSRVLRSHEVAFVAQELEVLDELPDPLGVPCHRDWQPRNWLVDDVGAVSIIDFEHARVGPWHEDLHRLWWNQWMRSPHLADDFFEGYGRALNESDRRGLLATSTLGHLATIVWAHEHEDADFGAHARRCVAQAALLAQP